MKNVKIKSPFDGLVLDVAIIEPKGEPKAIVQFSHGMSEHKERYFDFMNYLAKNGYVCIIHDHRGHGASIRQKGDHGYFYTEDISAIVDDLHEVSKLAKNEYPNLPLYIFSHSMGTLVARNYLKKYDSEVAKVVLCGPPTENNAVGIALALSKISKPFHGAKKPNHFLNNSTFKGYNGNSSVPNSWLSENTENVTVYNDDELCGFVFTTNGFINLFKLQKGAFNAKDWNVSNENLPIFVIAGSDDPVIGSKEKFGKLVLFLKKLGYNNVDATLYKNNRHEILNEKNKLKIYADVLKFFESK